MLLVFYGYSTFGSLEFEESDQIPIGEGDFETRVPTLRQSNLAPLATLHISAVGKVEQDSDVLVSYSLTEPPHLHVGPCRVNVVIVARLRLRARDVVVERLVKGPKSAIDDADFPPAAGIKLRPHLLVRQVMVEDHEDKNVFSAIAHSRRPFLADSGKTEGFADDEWEAIGKPVG